MFEYSIDEKNRPKSLALRGRVDALNSAEIQKVFDRLIQTGERMTLVDFVEMNQEDVKRRWGFLKHVAERSFKPPEETPSAQRWLAERKSFLWSEVDASKNQSNEDKVLEEVERALQGDEDSEDGGFLSSRP